MQDRSVATIDNILDAARVLFSEKQYADISLKQIVEAANITKGALYHHFPSKEALYLHLIYQSLDELNKTFEASLSASKGKSSKERLYLSLVSFLQTPPSTLAMVRSIRRNINVFSEPARTDLLQAYQAALPEKIESILAQGIADGEIVPVDVRLLSWQHIAVVEVSLHEYGRKLLGTPEEMASSIVTLLYQGIELSKDN